MALLLIFLQIQVIALLITAYALRSSLRRSTRNIVHKNSHRMDGSFSPKRHAIEIQSFDRACFKILEGMFFIFLISALAGLVVVGLCSLGFNWQLRVPDPPVMDPVLEAAFVDFINEWQWQLLAVYVVLAFFVFPPYFKYLHKKALNRYSNHANQRFLNYYRMESVNRMEHSEA